jgi:hypothetical protein
MFEAFKIFGTILLVLVALAVVPAVFYGLGILLAYVAGLLGVHVAWYAALAVVFVGLGLLRAVSSAIRGTK